MQLSVVSRRFARHVHAMTTGRPVSGGAQIEATFSEGLFEHEPAAGFEAILISRDMM